MWRARCQPCVSPPSKLERANLFIISLDCVTLGPEWSTWFDGLAITNEPQGEAVLAGPVADQATLHGLLAKIRDLGLPPLSVHRVERDISGSQH